ncbi:putative endopeptidase [Escherichia coli]|uniref:Putative endopeptidase n=1 Tax=Escherichia coli TaxID=562 RepID=A0A2X3JVG0_ECOLX|nr:putative endopeptidase [Escherichia coli]
MNRVLCVVIIALLVACGALSLGLNHYRDNAITYKAQRDKKCQRTEAGERGNY